MRIPYRLCPKHNRKLIPVVFYVWKKGKVIPWYELKCPRCSYVRSFKLYNSLPEVPGEMVPQYPPRPDHGVQEREIRGNENSLSPASPKHGRKNVASTRKRPALPRALPRLHDIQE